MATKKDDACLQKAADDEPIFVLRAQDVSAPALVRLWISMNPQISPEKKNDAEQLIERMRAWPKRREAD